MGNNQFCNCKCGANADEGSEEIYNTINNIQEGNEGDDETTNKRINNITPILKKKLNKFNSSTLGGNYSFLNEHKKNLSFEEDITYKNLSTDPMNSSKNNHLIKNNSLDSILLNKMLKDNSIKKEKEEPMINYDSSINDILKNGVKDNKIINEKGNKENKNVKDINPDILKLFDIKNNKNTNNNKKIRNKKNSVNNENQNNNLSNSLIIDEINNLNDIFKTKNRDLNNTINIGWKQMNIYNIISNTKLNSNKKDEIMYKGNINKLVLSHIFKNCSMNIEKFCILTKEDFSIFHTKENFLLMKKPLFKILLNQVENCGRIDFSQLRINNLNGHFFMYINMKSEEEKYNLDNHEDDDDIIYKIVLKEGIGKFFVLFSNKENLIDEWVCAINYFIQKKEN